MTAVYDRMQKVKRLQLVEKFFLKIVFFLYFCSLFRCVIERYVSEIFFQK